MEDIDIAGNPVDIFLSLLNEDQKKELNIGFIDYWRNYCGEQAK